MIEQMTNPQGKTSDLVESYPASGLISRQAVLETLDRLAEQHANMAIAGEPDHARRREAMEAAFTHAKIAVAFLPYTAASELTRLEEENGKLRAEVADAETLLQGHGVVVMRRLQSLNVEAVGGLREIVAGVTPEQCDALTWLKLNTLLSRLQSGGENKDLAQPGRELTAGAEATIAAPMTETGQ